MVEWIEPGARTSAVFCAVFMFTCFSLRPMRAMCFLSFSRSPFQLSRPSATMGGVYNFLQLLFDGPRAAVKLGE